MVTFNENVSAEIVLLSEDIGSDDETDFAVDTALIYMNTGFGQVSAGKLTVPFTTGETNMIEDSATLIEPVGVGLSLSDAFNGFEYTVYAADPNKDDVADLNDNTFDKQTALGFGDLAGVSLNFALNDNLAFNASYARLDGESGKSGAIIGSIGNFGFILEATSTDISDNTRSNIEVSYNLGMGLIAASMQQDAEENDFNLSGSQPNCMTQLASTFRT